MPSVQGEAALVLRGEPRVTLDLTPPSSEPGVAGYGGTTNLTAPLASIHDWRFAWNADLCTAATDEAHCTLHRSGHSAEMENNKKSNC